MIKETSANENGRINIMLNYGPLGLVRATTHHIHVDGMSIDTGNISLPCHSEVEVTLSFRKGNKLFVHQIDALVTDTSQDKTQLSFTNLQEEAIPELKAVLESKLPTYQ
ncbi:MAG: hypothetical protein KAJ19_02180 [Gammaproteobacteria bacterium]|nr:hypothetical protein [Gammaproteobacteria bacterium]